MTKVDILYSMKIEYINSEKFVAYINKKYYVFNKNTIETFIINLLKTIKKKYNIDIYSNFKVNCYICDLYGIILVINKKYDSFCNYSKKINIDIKFINGNFLFEIDDYFLNNKVNGNIYIYNNKYYMDIKYDDIKIFEHIKKIIYGDNVIKIIDNSNKII